jgi:UDP-N-acetylmuramyl pentapeptide phosphotransferase/UDP-N-acetylglucosamine-1-phosphate transferase
MVLFLCSFLLSVLFGFLIVHFSNEFLPNSLDIELDGIQKFHSSPVPRIGGLGIYLTISIISIFLYFNIEIYGNYSLLLILAAAPVFFVGLIEDLTKKISARARLLAGFASALFGVYLFQTWLMNLQILGLDTLLQTYPPIAILITCIAISGVSHSFNLIDGYNGLTGVVGFIIFIGISYVSFQVSDSAIFFVSLLIMGSILGFLVWNYPHGLMFLGDGGAYFLGFTAAQLSILLTSRNHEVSKWFPMLLCLYPIFETLFTIYRRIFIMRVSVGRPDAFHLHQLIHRRVMIHWKNESSVFSKNSATSPFLWILSSCTALPALLFWNNAKLLMIFCFLFSILYITIYWRLSLFQIPDLNSKPRQ